MAGGGSLLMRRLRGMQRQRRQQNEGREITVSSVVRDLAGLIIVILGSAVIFKETGVRVQTQFDPTELLDCFGLEELDIPINRVG